MFMKKTKSDPVWDMSPCFWVGVGQDTWANENFNDIYMACYIDHPSIYANQLKSSQASTCRWPGRVSLILNFNHLFRLMHENRQINGVGISWDERLAQEWQESVNTELMALEYLGMKDQHKNDKNQPRLSYRYIFF